MTTSKHYPRAPGSLPTGCGDGGWCIQCNADGSVEYILEDFGTGFRRTTRTKRRSPMPTLLDVWWPVLASTAISLLVLFIVLREGKKDVTELRLLDPNKLFQKWDPTSKTPGK